jgi:hypothetical protein
MQVQRMSHRLSSMDFVTLARALWKNHLQTKYQHPDGWISYLRAPR